MSEEDLLEALKMEITAHLNVRADIAISDRPRLHVRGLVHQGNFEVHTDGYAVYFPTQNKIRKYPFEEPDSIDRIIADIKEFCP